MKKTETIAEQLIAAIMNADISRYALAKQSGVDEAVLSRFVNRKRTMSFDSLERVCEVLRLELTQKKTRKRKGK